MNTNNGSLVQGTKVKDFGDFQTPYDLARRICRRIKDTGFLPEVIVEPTSGEGNFVFAALEVFHDLERVYCVDIQESYKDIFDKRREDYFSRYNHIKTRVDFFRDNLFLHEFDSSLLKKRILIVGNPPWVTNKELSSINSSNLPVKENFKQLSGMDALTGKSNFDIAEYMILKILNDFKNTNARIAMMCKTVVVRNIIRDLPNYKFKIKNVEQLLIDAKKEFDVHASAAVFMADLNEKASEYLCTVKSLYDPTTILERFGWYTGRFVSNVDLYTKTSHLDGLSMFEWRQGMKHDASDVFVLVRNGKSLLNGTGEIVDVEPDRIYPFLKGSELRSYYVSSTGKSIIITQKSVRDDTRILSQSCPKLWSYLTSKSDILGKRKSKIYKNRPQFSIFGIGDYSFAPYKIGIASMYKEPRFTLVPPIDGKPVMLDDTSYFIGFNSLEQAVLIWILLNTELSKEFFSSIAFIDSQRPYTKEVLMRLSLSRLLDNLPTSTIVHTYNSIKGELNMKIDEKSCLQLISDFGDGTRIAGNFRSIDA